jgi:hypothetical protein
MNPPTGDSIAPTRSFAELRRIAFSRCLRGGREEVPPFARQ